MTLRMAPLGEVADFVNGFAFKPSDWGTLGKPIVRIQNLSKTGTDFNYTDKPVPDKYCVENGDLLVSWSATLGVYKWLGPKAVVNQHIFKVVPDTKRIDIEYLRHALSSSIHEMEKFTHGSTMKHINRNEFLSHQIPLPPLAEQRRIAAILDKADALRQKRKQAIALLDSLTQSIFLEMFGDPQRNERAWPTVELNDVLERIDSGKSPICLDRPATKDEWGVLKLSAVTSGNFRPEEQKALPHNVIPKPELEVRENDILFTRKNTYALVAACTLVKETRPRLLLSDLIFRLVPSVNTPIDKEFLASCLSYPTVRRNIQRLAGGAAGSMPNISKKKLMGVGIILPPKELQLGYCQRVQQLSSLQKSASFGLGYAERLFSSLQHRAFSGQL